jgi:serine/threonine protein phosphatase PrpC
VAREASTIAALWGRDHAEGHGIDLVSPTSNVALAITKGGVKLHDHTDPNEDVVAASVDERGTLLLCADGHYGLESSHEAVEFVLNALGKDPSADMSDDELIRIFHGAGDAVLRRTTAPDSLNRESRTTLALAVVTGHRMRWASMGDSAVMVASVDDARAFGNPIGHYVGWPMTPDQVDKRLPRGTMDLLPGEWVVLATDGFTHFVQTLNPEQVVQDLVRRPIVASDLARRLVETALDGGAGDNVAVAVLGPKIPG